jgi:hypothetical protein
MAAATSTTCRSATPTSASSTRPSAAAVRTTSSSAAAATSVGTACARTTSTMAGGGACTATRPTAAAISAMYSGKAAASGLQRATVVGNGCGDGCDSRSVHDLLRYIEGLQLGVEGQGDTLSGHHFRAAQSVFHHVRLHMRGLDVG